MSGVRPGIGADVGHRCASGTGARVAVGRTNARQSLSAGGRGFGFCLEALRWAAALLLFFFTLKRAGAPAGLARVPLPRPWGPRRVGFSPGVPGCGLSPVSLL